jgi:hypothetical protein
VMPAVPVQAAPPPARLTLGAKIRHTSRSRGGSTLGAPPWPWLREARAEERPRLRRHPPAIPTSDRGQDESEITRAQSRLRSGDGHGLNPYRAPQSTHLSPRWPPHPLTRRR